MPGQVRPRCWLVLRIGSLPVATVVPSTHWTSETENSCACGGLLNSPLHRYIHIQHIIIICNSLPFYMYSACYICKQSTSILCVILCEGLLIIICDVQGLTMLLGEGGRDVEVCTLHVNLVPRLFSVCITFLQRFLDTNEQGYILHNILQCHVTFCIFLWTGPINKRRYFAWWIAHTQCSTSWLSCDQQYDC